MNKIMKYGELKAYIGHLIGGGAELVRQAHISAKDKVKSPHLQAEIESLKSEIKELKALREAMRHEESKAGEQALRLYWDNCNLEKYRNHADGILTDWVLRSEHDIEMKKFKKLKLDFAALSKSNSEMEKAWLDYIQSETSKQTPPLPEKPE